MPHAAQSIFDGYEMVLKKITAMHMLLNGEAFWLLDRRLPAEYGGAPQRIDILLPELVRTLTDPGADHRWRRRRGCVSRPTFCRV